MDIFQCNYMSCDLWIDFAFFWITLSNFLWNCWIKTFKALIFPDSKFSFFVDAFTSSTFGKREVSWMVFCQADHLYKLEIKEALMLILVELKNLFSSIQKSIKTPFCLWFSRSFRSRESNPSSAPEACNLNKGPMCQTWSKAFEMSRNTPFTSTAGLLSKALCISSIVDSSCAIH